MGEINRLSGKYKRLLSRKGTPEELEEIRKEIDEYINAIGPEYADLHRQLDTSEPENAYLRRLVEGRLEEIRGEITDYLAIFRHSNEEMQAYFENNPEGWVYFPPLDRFAERAGNPPKSYLLVLQKVALGKNYNKVLVDQSLIAWAMEKVLAEYQAAGANGATFLTLFYRKLRDKQKDLLKSKALAECDALAEYDDLEKIDDKLYKRCFENPEDVLVIENTKQVPLLEKMGKIHYCFRVAERNDLPPWKIYVRESNLPIVPARKDDEAGLRQVISEEHTTQEQAGFDEWADGRHDEAPELFAEVSPEHFDDLKAELLGRSLDYFCLKKAGEGASETSRSIVDFYRAVEQHDGAIEKVREEYELTKLQAKQIPSWRALYTFDVMSVCHVGTAQSMNHRLFFYLDRNERVHRAFCVVRRGMAPEGMADDAAAFAAPQTQERLRRFLDFADGGLVERILVEEDGGLRLFLAEAKESVFAKGKNIDLKPCDLQFDYALTGNANKVLQEHLGISGPTLHKDRDGEKPGRLERYKEIRSALFDGCLASGAMKNVYLYADADE